MININLYVFLFILYFWIILIEYCIFFLSHIYKTYIRLNLLSMYCIMIFIILVRSKIKKNILNILYQCISLFKKI